MTNPLTGQAGCLSGQGDRAGDRPEGEVLDIDGLLVIVCQYFNVHLFTFIWPLKVSKNEEEKLYRQCGGMLKNANVLNNGVLNH